MAFGSPPDTEPSLVFSPSEYSKSPFEHHWQGPHLAGIAPMSPQTRFDTNRWVDTSRPACSPEVACCDDEDCSAECSADCTTMCHGFVDCDKSTACSDACSDAGCDEAECEEAVCDEAHCEEVLCTESDCPDTETACFDTSCFTDSNGNLDQAALDFLNQNDSFQQWCGTTGLMPSCHSNHAPCNFSGPEFGHTAQPNMEKQFRMSPSQDAPSLLKSADFQQYSSQCTYGKHPHIFDSPTSSSQGDLIPGNVLHCNLHGAQSCMDSSNQQCNFDFGSANYTANSPLGFVPWSSLQISQHRNHQHFAHSRALQLQYCHSHAHVHHHPLHMSSPSTHTPSLSIGSSPVISPIGGGQTASSTFTTPELSATAESYVCKWVHKSNGILTRCGARFPDSSKLQEHLTLAHSDALEGARGHGYYCCWEGCHRPDDPFSQKSKLQGHFLTHSNRVYFPLFVLLGYTLTTSAPR